MAEFLASLRQSSVSHDQPEIIKKILLYMLNMYSFRKKEISTQIAGIKLHSEVTEKSLNRVMFKSLNIIKLIWLGRAL